MSDIESLRRSMRYDAETGNLYWLARDDVPLWWNTKYAGSLALTSLAGTGYPAGRFQGKGIRAHRAAWAIFYGFWPTDIDHINGNKADNRIKNLRQATHTENMQNRRISRHNTSGAKGVRKTAGGRYEARITVGKKQLFLGGFGCQTAAAAAYNAAAVKHFGAFASLNSGGM